MRKNISFLIFYLFFHFAIGQTTTNYWVLFKDKKDSPYSVNVPSAYLSQRSITRREKQNIAITENDLPVNPIYINGVKSIGVEIKNRSKWFNALTITANDETKINAIKSLPYVEGLIKINIIPITNGAAKLLPSLQSGVGEIKNGTPSSSVIPVKPEENTSVESLNYGSSFKQSHQIGIDCMHNMGYLGQGMVIAQLDAGFYKVDSLPAFDSLRVNHQILGTWDFVEGNAMVYEDYEHGMNVLSCMGGNLPGLLVGTAPKAKYWLLRTETIFSESWQEEINWALAAEFADSVGADVINSSLGYAGGMTDPAQDHTYSDMDGKTTIAAKAAVHAARVGIFVTASAGNSGGPSWYKIVTPADADSIFTVGAVDSADVITPFSSRGLSFDGRIKPNTVARGGSAIVACSWGGVCPQSGTSFSSPITAGAVACLWQAHPGKTNYEILQAIEQSASQHNTPDSIMGYGIPNFCTANTLLTGIDIQKMNTDSLNVYPNPFNADFNIAFYSDKKQVIDVELFDISGRSIFQLEKSVSANTNSVFKSGTFGEKLTEGVYILRIATPQKIYFKKIIKK